MLEIKESDCFSASDKILYNIFELLQSGQTNAQPAGQPKPEPAKAVSIGKCPVCGKEWSNNGQRLACIRKHKREGKK